MTDRLDNPWRVEHVDDDVVASEVARLLSRNQAAAS
jgi:hypothetical protein